jgi:hypothetical protein
MKLSSINIVLALSLVINTTNLLAAPQPTRPVMSSQESIRTPKSWPTLKTPFGVLAQLKTIMLTDGTVSYQLTVAAGQSYVGNVTLELLDKDSFRLAKTCFTCEGTQVYTGEINCTVDTYKRVASWNLVKGLF